MPTKKLRGGDTIFVDPQIKRWRQRLRKKGVNLGKHMQSAERARVKARKGTETNTDAKLLAKKWF